MQRARSVSTIFLLLIALAACDGSGVGLALRPTAAEITPTIAPTVVAEVIASATPALVPTDTQPPAPTNTALPAATDTTAPIPVPTDTSVPTAARVATATPVQAAVPGSTVLAESAHPYASDFNDTWLVSNADVEAGGTRAHFSRIELEKDVDWLIIMDGKDAEMQRFTGSFPDGVWTEAIPGSLVKLRLISDGSVQQWGFTLDELKAVPYTSLAYSPHPYPYNAADLRWTINNAEAGAQCTKVHFSRIDLEQDVDWIVVSDLTETSYQWITGRHPDGLWTVSVPGNGVVVKLISDGSVQQWGFNIDGIQSAPPDKAEAQPEVGKSLAESKHPISSSEEWSLVNTDAAASFTKVHFTRLELGDSVVTLLDGNDKSVQVLRGSKEGDFWSDDVPGRVVKIKLDQHGYGAPWGFRLDQMANGEP